jgi:hypothetical protein
MRRAFNSGLFMVVTDALGRIVISKSEIAMFSKVDGRQVTVKAKKEKKAKK